MFIFDEDKQELINSVFIKSFEIREYPTGRGRIIINTEDKNYCYKSDMSDEETVKCMQELEKELNGKQGEAAIKALEAFEAIIQHFRKETENLNTSPYIIHAFPYTIPLESVGKDKE